MQSRLLIAAMLSILSLSSQAQDAAPPTWSLRASIAGEELTGEWELSQLSSAASRDEVLSGAETSQIRVALGSSFPIQVKLVDPAGVVMDVTGSAKLIYRPKACLTVASDGMATVAKTPSSLWACEKDAPVPLTVIYADQAAGVAAVNMYLMRVD